MVIDKKSWHYHIIYTYTSVVNSREISDSCSYIKKLLVGILNIFIIITMFVFFIYTMVVDPLLWVIVTGDFNIENFPSFSKTGITLWFCLLFTFFIIPIIHYTQNNSDKPDGFVKKAYKSWKNKVCVKLEFK